MKEFRLGKGTTEHYTSLSELGQAWGCKPVIKQTKDKDKLQKQRERFCGFHKCKACGQPMTYLGGSMMACTNENCKGVKLERKDNEGNANITYLTSYELLEDKFAEIAENIFFETN